MTCNAVKGADFERDATNDQYSCPEGHALKQFRRNYSDPNCGPNGKGTARYRALKEVCHACPSKAKCCPNADARKIRLRPRAFDVPSEFCKAWFLVAKFSTAILELDIVGTHRTCGQQYGNSVEILWPNSTVSEHKPALLYISQRYARLNSRDDVIMIITSERRRARQGLSVSLDRYCSAAKYTTVIVKFSDDDVPAAGGE